MYKLYWQKVVALHRVMWVCLFLACLGASWFSYQYFLVPQAKSFAPDWQGAQWVQAADGNAAVAYFRYVTDLNVVPDDAFVTVAASQIFNLYMNGYLIGSNEGDVLQGGVLRPYMYDVTSALQLGANVIALRVANLDEGTPSVRASFGIVWGKSVYYYGTGNGWQATARSAAVYPRYVTDTKIWTKNNFDASSWPSVQKVASSPTLLSPILTVNPLIYEHPLSTDWLSAGANHQAYFIRQISLPIGITGAWLRLAATGTANVFINGNLFVTWNGQAPVAHQQLVSYFSNVLTNQQYKSGLALGVYDISPYLHPGVNTIAIYVTAPGVISDQVNPGNPAMLVDMLTSDLWGHNSWLSDNGWHTSERFVEGWTQGSKAALAWPFPTLVGHPGSVRKFYLPDSNALLPTIGTQRDVRLIPDSLACEIILFSIGAVLGLWLLVSLVVMRRYYRSRSDALETMSLAYVPALACEAMLVVLSREPQIPQPFPYTWSWALVLIMLVVIGYILLWLNARTALPGRGQAPPLPYTAFGGRSIYSRGDPCGRPGGSAKESRLSAVIGSFPHGALLGEYRILSYLRDCVLAWLRSHWAIIPLVLIAVPLISYNLSYEPFWQDELASYYAAKGILAHGLPITPAGFLYPKGELYSYLLALTMLIFGGQASAVRMVSSMEYLISIPIIYFVGCYFFERRVALLAAAMLALSPFSLVWGREVRMYEQAQVLTLLVVYIFYKAIEGGRDENVVAPTCSINSLISLSAKQFRLIKGHSTAGARPKRQRVHLVYLAIGCLIAMYLSHEETFIILPALVICVLMASRGLSAPTINRGATGALFNPEPTASAKRSGARINTSALGKHRLPAVLYQKHWWYAAAIGVSAIAIQLLIVKATHPPVLGTDQTQRPPVQLTTDNIPFYIGLLFFQTSKQPWIIINSVLATVGCIWARHSKDLRVKYCALFLAISFFTLMFVFSMQADRYFYPLLPIYYLMGAYAMLEILSAIWAFARSRIVLPQPGRSEGSGSTDAEILRCAQDESQDTTQIMSPSSVVSRSPELAKGKGRSSLLSKRLQPGGSVSPSMRAMVIFTAGLVCVCVLIGPILPIGGYNLFISRMLGFSYHRHYGDYDAAGQYVQQHWQKGDIVISVSPDIIVYYYAGHSDYFFSINRALFLFERDGHIVDTSTGGIALLRQEDFQATLAKYTRIWIIADDSYYFSHYQLDVLKRFVLPADFRIVYEGYVAAVYFRGG